MVERLREELLQGKNIVLYDFDGPREDETPVCKELSLDLLIQKINDPRFPFGHGYVVGMMLLGISVDDVCK